jgi:hypothetical protein
MSITEWQDAARAIAIFGIAVIGFQLTESFIAAWLSGWIDLSRKRRAPVEPSLVERLDESLIAVIPRPVTHTFALRIVCIPTRGGLYLQARQIHRIPRVPLLVPWSEVHVGGTNPASPNPREIALGADGALSLKINANFVRRVSEWKCRAMAGEPPAVRSATIDKSA